MYFVKTKRWLLVLIMIIGYCSRTYASEENVTPYFSYKTSSIYVSSRHEFAVTTKGSMSFKLKDLKWESSDPKIATVEMSESDAEYLKKSKNWTTSEASAYVYGHKAGTVTITARIGDAFVSKKVIIRNPLVKFKKKSVAIEVEECQNVFSYLKWPHAIDRPKLTLSNSKIAEIDDYLIYGIKPGTTYLYASVNGKRVAKCKITVKKPKIILNKKKVILQAGKSEKLRAKVKGLSKDAYWTSENPVVASVDANGVVTGWNAGSTFIICNANTVITKCKVTVRKSSAYDTKKRNQFSKYKSILSHEKFTLQSDVTITVKQTDTKFALADLDGSGIPALVVNYNNKGFDVYSLQGRNYPERIVLYNRDSHKNDQYEKFTGYYPKTGIFTSESSYHVKSNGKWITTHGRTYYMTIQSSSYSYVGVDLIDKVYGIREVINDTGYQDIDRKLTKKEFNQWIKKHTKGKTWKKVTWYDNTYENRERLLR